MLQHFKEEPEPLLLKENGRTQLLSDEDRSGLHRKSSES